MYTQIKKERNRDREREEENGLSSFTQIFHPSNAKFITFLELK